VALSRQRRVSETLRKKLNTGTPKKKKARRGFSVSSNPHTRVKQMGEKTVSHGSPGRDLDPGNNKEDDNIPEEKGRLGERIRHLRNDLRRSSLNQKDKKNIAPKENKERMRISAEERRPKRPPHFKDNL